MSGFVSSLGGTAINSSNMSVGAQVAMSALIDASGSVVQRYAYDPWGRRRNPYTWANLTASQIEQQNFLFDRGYTGHEHLDYFGLINMNGRIFDPVVARFLSPDPIIQDTENSQNYNGYSYCLNNPLRYTDPSGYSFESIMKGFLNIVTMPARILSAGNAWVDDRLNGSSNPYGYYTVDYIVHGILPGPGNTFYLPNKGTDYSHRSWPRGVGGYMPGDGEHLMGGGSRTPFLAYRQKSKKRVEEKVEQGDFNNFDLFNLYDSSIETPGMSFDTPPGIDGDETQEEKKASSSGDGVNLTNEFNQRVSQMEAVFGAIGETFNNMYGGPVLSYPTKFLAFGYIQYKGVGTEFMDPKASRSSSFTKNGGGYVNEEHFSPDDFGNYFYGVAAKAMGITLLDAVQGAGIYAVFSGTATDWSNWYGLFDERKDTQMIKRGYYGQ